MPRIARLTDPENPTIYHLMSRTALDGFPMGAVEKDHLLSLIKKYSNLYFTEILGFAILDNHFHIVVKMNTSSYPSDKELMQRLKNFYRDTQTFVDSQLPFLRTKFSDISNFMKDIKQNFTRFYNKRHNRNGFFWGGRFKSLIVEHGETLVNLLAYVDLNPIRAGIVKKPESYRWSSMGYHSQKGNKDNWLSLDFGIHENISKKECYRKYRAFVYEMGGLGEKGVIQKSLIEKEKKRGYKYSQKDYFCMKTRWFTDSGVIGSKAFIQMNADKFKAFFNSRHNKKPNPISGLNGIFSIKRLI